jgi:ketosteroid isomerase-like protein
MTVLECVRSFIKAVNAADVTAVCDLMTEDHLFIDSDGGEVRGREAMRRGWIGYFSMMPDYKIQVQETYSRGTVVVMIGTATGTYSPDGKLRPENRWRVPAAWRAVVRGGRVAVWQVFVNPEPIARLMGSHRKQAARRGAAPTGRRAARR